MAARSAELPKTRTSGELLTTSKSCSNSRAVAATGSGVRTAISSVWAHVGATRLIVTRRDRRTRVMGMGAVTVRALRIGVGCGQTPVYNFLVPISHIAMEETGSPRPNRCSRDPARSAACVDGSACRSGAVFRRAVVRWWWCFRRRNILGIGWIACDVNVVHAVHVLAQDEEQGCERAEGEGDQPTP